LTTIESLVQDENSLITDTVEEGSAFAYVDEGEQVE